jgi:DNA-binding beta-propeller fold protein YncE
MVRFALRFCCVAVVLWCGSTTAAKDKPPIGVVAASAGERVYLVDPTTGGTTSIPAGPVAWLFPAPGGILFAPDLVDSRTTVIDLRTLSPRDPIPGVTMPRFGTLPDRYLVVAKQLLVMSYPERALMNRFEISFDSPWQVEVVGDNAVLFVLERRPQGSDDVQLTAVNLNGGRLVYRRPVAGDVRHFAVSPALGLMALAAAETGQVVLADPATLAPVATFQTSGKPIDLVFTGDGSILAVAVEKSDDDGELLIWKFKQKKQGLQRKKDWTVQLSGRPGRLASSPDGRHVAAGLVSGRLQVVALETQSLVATADLSDAPRDVVWCDPSIEGPILPDWSDDDAPTLDLGGR